MLTLFPRIKPNPQATPSTQSTETANLAVTRTSDESSRSEQNPEPASFADRSGTSGNGNAPRSVGGPTASAGDMPSGSLAAIHSLAAIDPELLAFLAEPAPNFVPVNLAIAGTESAASGATVELDARAPDLPFAAANIFDEIEILHEAGGERAPAHPFAPEREPEPPLATLDPLIEARREANCELKGEEGGIQSSAVEVRGDVALVLPIEESGANALVSDEREPFVVEIGSPEKLTAHAAAPPAESIVDVAPTPEVPMVAQVAPVDETPAEITSAEIASAPALADMLANASAPAMEATEVAPVVPVAPVRKEPTASASTIEVAPSAAKAPRGKAGFFALQRVPEPEAMDDSGEVDAYASAAGQNHLDAIDDTFVAHAQLLLKGRGRGRALDIGTGPGQIVMKLGYRLTRWKFVGVDRSLAMIKKAEDSLATAPEVAGRVEFRVADGNALDFPDATFDLVMCNSVLHHLAEPQNLFSEIARLVKPGGAILLRDLRRPSRFAVRLHIRKHGKHYSGEMHRLFAVSVRAAYTEEELRAIVAASPLRGVRLFRHGKTHIGFERALGTVSEKAIATGRAAGR